MSTILIVEDRPLDRKLLATLLRANGHDVIVAADGEEGLRLFGDSRPDVIISDILMPKMDGLELVRRIRAEASDRPETPIIFYTATYHEREARRLADECGVFDVLTKPSEPSVILAKVAAALQFREHSTSAPPDRLQSDRDHWQVVSRGLVGRNVDVAAIEQRMAAIVEVSREIAIERDSRALLVKVCDEARRVTLAQYAAIGLLNDDGTLAPPSVTSGIGVEAASSLRLSSITDAMLNPVIAHRESLRSQPGQSSSLPAQAGPLTASSVLAVPVASSSHVYGWLGLWNKLGAAAFADPDEQVAGTLGTHAGVAYENARLYEDLHRHAAILEQRTRLAAFGADIGMALTANANLEDMLTRCAEAIVRHLDGALARIWTLNVDDQTLELQATAGVSADVRRSNVRVPLSGSTIGLIATQRVPHTTNAVAEDPQLGDSTWAETEGIVSFAGYPLLVDEELVGVMAMFARQPLTDDALQAMASVASQIAVGIARKRAEAQLHSIVERTDFALASAKMGVWEWDVVSDSLTWSPTMAPLFGLDHGQAPKTQREFLALVHADDRTGLLEAGDQAAAEDGGYSYELRTVWPDGSTHWLDMRAYVSRDAAYPSGRIIGVAMDMSERKSLEAQLRQAQKMEAVGQLAGGVAHDFNNLLTAILGYAKLLAREFDKSDRRARDLEQIIRAGDRAAGLTKQLLAFSRKQVLQPTVVDLNALVTENTEMLRRLIGEHIQLSTLLASNLRAVRADAGQIEQVLVNLVVNARDAMAAGGRIAIETANVGLDEGFVLRHEGATQGAHVMIAVVDTGVGMDDETKRHLFEPFFTTKGRDRGTGLGLATVYGIVKQSGGYITVDSELGHGATFRVYLPVVDGAVEETRPAAPPPLSGAAGTETVLLVEDEEAVRFLSRSLLERLGYHVIDAENPAQAEVLFHEHRDAIDLVVTDIVMPGATGPMLFQRLKASRPDLKVLYMSGYTGVISDGQLEPGVPFLQKPFSAEDLAYRVREVLDR